MPASIQARGASAVTSSGFASSVTSAPSRTRKRARSWASSRAIAAGGNSEGVPPPR